MTSRVPADAVGLLSAAFAGGAVTLLGWWGSRRFGLPGAQDRLVTTLKETVDAQESRIAVLEAAVKQRDDLIASLTERVRHLEQALRDAELLRDRRRRDLPVARDRREAPHA